MKILVNSHPRKIRCYDSPYLDLLVTPHQPFGILHAQPRLFELQAV